MNNKNRSSAESNLFIEQNDLATLIKFAADNQLDLNKILAQIESTDLESGRIMRLCLTDLEISNLSALQDLSELAILLVQFSEDLSKLPDFESFKAKHKLKEITFLACPNLSDASALSSVSNLEKLCLFDCNITDFSFLSHLETLNTLDLDLPVTSKDKIDLAPIAQLKKLESLNVFKSNDIEVSNIEQIASLANLKELSLMFHLLPHELTVLDSLSALEDLSTGFVDEIETLAPLLQHRNLQKLRFFAYGVTSLAGIEKLSKLQELHLSSYRIPDFSPLTLIPNLRKIIISDATHEADWQSLTKLKQIKELEIFCCQELRDISFLKKMPWLESVVVRVCKAIENLEVLDELEGVVVRSSGNVAEDKNLAGLC